MASNIPSALNDNASPISTMIAINWDDSDSDDSISFRYHRYFQRSPAINELIEETQEEIQTKEVKDCPTAREWRSIIAMELETDLDRAAKDKDFDLEAQIHNEISMFNSFEDLDYWKDLEGDSSITIDSIREEIRSGVKAFIDEPHVFSSSPLRPSSPLSSQLASVQGTPSKPRRKFALMPKQERLRLAVKAVEEDEVKVANAARTFGVNRQTICNRLKGKRSHDDYARARRHLLEHEESAILNFIDQWVSLGFPPQLSMIEERVQMLRAKRMEESPNLGRHWTARFLRRHPEFRTKFPRQLDQTRYLNTNADVFNKWFDLLKTVCEKYGISQGDMYNMDEKGYLLGIAGSGNKVVIRRKDKHAFAVHSGDRRLVTVIEFVSSRGKRFQPMIIFQGAKIQKAWVNAWPEPVYAHSERGWTDNDHEVSWLEKVFDPQTKHLGGRRLLFVDGHQSHVSAKFIQSCWSRDIVPLCLPPHTTHCLQPLDVGCFGPLDKAYKKGLEERNSMGVVEIDKIEFLTILKNAREKVLTETVIMSAWATSGIYFYDPDAVLAKLSSFVTASSFISDNSQNSEIVFADRESLLTSIENLNPYASSYKSDLRRIKFSINHLYSDIDLFRDSTRRLFKANVARESRRINKKKESTSGFDGTAFGRVLTENDAKRYVEEEQKKEEQLRLTKMLKEDKRIDNDTKRLVNAWEVEDRKMKRAELKAQKELEDAMRPKRQYRKKVMKSPSPSPNISSLSSLIVSIASPISSITSHDSRWEHIDGFGPEIDQMSQYRSLTPSMGGYVYPK